MSPSGTALVLRSGALGDFVLTVPVLEALRASLPGWRLVYLGRSEFGNLARRAGLVDEVLPEDRPEVVSLFSRSPDAGHGLARSLGRIDLAVSFVTSDVLTRNLLAAGAAEVVSCAALPPLSQPADVRPPAGGRTHAADHLLSALTGRFGDGRFGVGRIGVRLPATPRLAVDGGLRERARRVLSDRGIAPGGFLAVHPGSGSKAKNWPAERFAEVARRAREEHGLKVLLFLGPAETEHADASRNGTIRLKEPDLRARNALAAAADEVFRSPRLTLLAGVLAEAACYVGNDSGVTHLAAACGAPVVAVFGPTDPAVWGPRGERVRLVRDPSGRLERVEAATVLAEVRPVLDGA